MSPGQSASPTDVDEDVTALPLRRSDVHTRAMVKLVSERVTGWNADPPTPEALVVPAEHGPLEKLDVVPGFVAVPTLDEDGQKFPLGAKATVRVTRSLPLADDADGWSSLNEADRVVGSFTPLLPPVDVTWSEPTSDRAIELLAFQGLGAHRLSPIEEEGGAAFVVDLSWMRGLPVRAGLEPYGACAYFSADTSLLRIYTSHDDQHHRPGDAGWEDAKWRWRTSLMTAVTVADHLGATHFLFSNVMVTAVREQLPEDHPLRRFLKPYTYRTVDVNHDAAIALSPEGGLAHRTFGLTYPGLTRLLLGGIERATFEPFPRSVAAEIFDQLGDAFPYGADGTALYGVIGTHVAEYVELFFPDGGVADDLDVRSWWRAIVSLAPHSELAPLHSADQVVDLLTQMLFTVTGVHGQVGNVVGYLTDPAFMGSKIRAGARQSDVQSTIQLLNLAALTGLQAPPLLADYSHLLLDDRRAEATAVLGRFQEALGALSAEIESRNETRRQPFQTFNPIYLESSVSV